MGWFKRKAAEKEGHRSKQAIVRAKTHLVSQNTVLDSDRYFLLKSYTLMIVISIVKAEL